MRLSVDFLPRPRVGRGGVLAIAAALCLFCAVLWDSIQAWQRYQAVRQIRDRALEQTAAARGAVSALAKTSDPVVEAQDAETLKALNYPWTDVFSAIPDSHKFPTLRLKSFQHAQREGASVLVYEADSLQTILQLLKTQESAGTGDWRLLGHRVVGQGQAVEAQIRWSVPLPPQPRNSSSQ